MKNLIIDSLLFLLVLTAFTACSSKTVSYQRTGRVQALDTDRQTIVLQSSAVAEHLEKAVYFAERNAFENLLFKGIPNSNQEQPLIENELEALANHELFFKQLLKGQEYQKYLMRSVVVNESKNRGLYSLRQELRIDLHALRKKLEDEGVIRSFGL